MDELVKLVTEKAGISQSQAQTAVTAVLGLLKQRLPAPIAGEVDKVVAGGGGSGAGDLGGMAQEAESTLGGFMKK